MAQELTVTASLSFAKGNVQANGLTKSGQRFNVNGTKYIRGVQSIGFAAAEAIQLGEIAAPGWLLVQNNDATNFVELHTQAAAGVAFAKLQPGEFALLRLGSGVTAPAAKADTAAVEIEYMVVEE